jgi:predicted DNA-binding transcriptional regulator AlpA
MNSRQARSPCAKSHHLDRRSGQLQQQVATALDQEKLLSTRELAPLLGVSTQWLEIGRHEGYGPAFVRIGSRRIRYRRDDVLSWLETRTHRSTAEYMSRRRNGVRRNKRESA